jgi:hypothetical protein
MPTTSTITRLLVTSLSIAVTFAAVTSCGGKSGATASSRSTDAASGTSSPPGEAAARAQLIAAADAICGELDRELAASKQKSLALPEIARFAPLNAALEQRAVADLAKLTPPASLARDWQQIIAYRRMLAEELVKLGRYAKARDRAGIKALVVSKQRVRQSLLAIATRDGFKQCSSAGGAGASRPGSPSSRVPSGERRIRSK